MKHTALYLRVSTEAQADEGYSLAAQAEKLEAYCRMKGIMQFRRYVDGGFSGSNLEKLTWGLAIFMVVVSVATSYVIPDSYGYNTPI